MTTRDGEEIVAYAYEVRNAKDEDWDKALAFTDPEEIWGKHDSMDLRNIRPLVEADETE